MRIHQIGIPHEELFGDFPIERLSVAGDFVEDKAERLLLQIREVSHAPSPVSVRLTGQSCWASSNICLPMDMGSPVRNPGFASGR